MRRREKIKNSFHTARCVGWRKGRGKPRARVGDMDPETNEEDEEQRPTALRRWRSKGGKEWNAARVVKGTELSWRHLPLPFSPLPPVQCVPPQPSMITTTPEHTPALTPHKYLQRERERENQRYAPGPVATRVAEQRKDGEKVSVPLSSPGPVFSLPASTDRIRNPLMGY